MLRKIFTSVLLPLALVGVLSAAPAEAAPPIGGRDTSWGCGGLC